MCISTLHDILLNTFRFPIYYFTDLLEHDKQDLSRTEFLKQKISARTMITKVAQTDFKGADNLKK